LASEEISLGGTGKKRMLVAGFQNFNECYRVLFHLDTKGTIAEL
jgi:hypothetical protein